MQVASLEHHLKASDVPPERLAANSQLSEEDKVAEVSRQFEAILLRQILQQGQKPVIQSGLVKDSATAGIYRDQTTQQLAESISKSGSFGLAKSVESQLSRQLRPHGAKAGAISNATAPPAGKLPTHPIHPLHPLHPIHPIETVTHAQHSVEHGAELLRAPRIPRPTAQPIFPKIARNP